MDFKSRLAMFEAKSKENAKRKDEGMKKQRTFTIANAKKNHDTQDKKDNVDKGLHETVISREEAKKDSNVTQSKSGNDAPVANINSNRSNAEQSVNVLAKNTEPKISINNDPNSKSNNHLTQKESEAKGTMPKEESNSGCSIKEKKEDIIVKQQESWKDNANRNTNINTVGQMHLSNKSVQDNIKELLTRFKEKKEEHKGNDTITKETVNETKPVQPAQPIELVDNKTQEKSDGTSKSNDNSNDVEKVNEGKPKEELKEMTIQKELENVFKAVNKVETVEEPKQADQIETQDNNNNIIIENETKDNLNIEPENNNVIIEDTTNVNVIAPENQIIEKEPIPVNNDEEQVKEDLIAEPEQLEETNVNATEEVELVNETKQLSPIEETTVTEEPQAIASTTVNDNTIPNPSPTSENNIHLDNDKTHNTNVIPQPENHTSISSSIHQLDQLKQSAEEQESWYENIINSNPDLLFASLSSEKIERWKQVLINQTPFESDTISLISNASETKDILNQKIILNDMNRTRKRERVLLPSFADQLTVYITYYVKTNGIEYKQGINEIVGAMLLLHYKYSLTFTETFNLIQGFMNKFITNYYRGSEMVALKSSMSLVKMLLKYHCPLLFYFFESLEIQPEMYTMSWFMTTYAGKLHLHILYRFWNYLINENDNMMIHYCVIAFLLMNKDLLMSSDLSLAVVILSQLTLYYEHEVDELFNLALSIRSRTPYSFKILANRLELFKENSKHIGELYQAIKPNEFVSLPIYPKEIFYIAYGGLDNVTCPNEDCNVGYNKNCPKKKLPCDYCDLHLTKDIKFIFVDLRIFSGKDKKSDSQTIGFLPNMIMIEQEELQLSNIHEILLERFNKEKGKYHFVFITSNTDYFKDYEDNFYEFNESVDYMEQNILYPTTKIRNKKLSIHHKTLKLMTQEEKSKLKEYDILRKTIEIFTKENIQYISFCYGGFASIHKESIMYDITLLNHDPKCQLCTKLKKSKLWKSTTKIEKMFQKQHDKEQMSESTIIRAKAQQKKVFMENTTEELISESKDCPTINYNQITQFICYSEHSIFFGFIKDKLESHERKEVMFMIKSKVLLMYLFPEVEGEDLNKINSVDIQIILSILPLKKMKNVVVMKYTHTVPKDEGSKSQKEVILYIDFLSEIESKKFIYAVNQRKRQLLI